MILNKKHKYLVQYVFDITKIIKPIFKHRPEIFAVQFYNSNNVRDKILQTEISIALGIVLVYVHNCSKYPMKRIDFLYQKLIMSDVLQSSTDMYNV